MSSSVIFLLLSSSVFVFRVILTCFHSCVSKVWLSYTIFSFEAETAVKLDFVDFPDRDNSELAFTRIIYSILIYLLNDSTIILILTLFKKSLTSY